MDILNNLNKRLNYYDKEENYLKATEEDIERLKNYSEIELPEDYIEFLKNIMDVAFIIDDDKTFEFWSVDEIMQQKVYYPFLKESLPNSLIIGSDLGDFFFFYGYGKEGFGLYFVENTCVDYDNAIKIANTLTEFMVDGLGFDICFDYC